MFPDMNLPAQKKRARILGSEHATYRDQVDLAYLTSLGIESPEAVDQYRMSYDDVIVAQHLRWMEAQG